MAILKIRETHSTSRRWYAFTIAELSITSLATADAKVCELYTKGNFLESNMYGYFCIRVFNVSSLRLPC